MNSQHSASRDWRTWATTATSATWALPVAVFVLVAGGFVLGWVVSERSERELARTQAELAGEQIAIRVEEYLRVRMDVVMQVRDHWLENDSPGIEGFETPAGVARQRYPEIDAINWVDADGIIQHVVPREPNLAALGRDLTRHEVASSVLAAARASGQPRITPPIELYQGGLGFAIYVPFVRQGKLEGFINAAFRLSPLIQACLERGVRDHYYFSIHDGETLVYSYEEEFPAGERYAASREIRVGDRAWELRVHPTPLQLKRSALVTDEVVSILGLLTAGFLAYLTRRILVSRRQLARSRERLRRVVEDTPAMICRYRLDGTLTFVNRPFADRIGLPPGRLIGSSLLQTLPEEERHLTVGRMEAQQQDPSLQVRVQRLDTADGVRWEEWRDRALLDEAGEVREFQSIGVDVTESHVAREALRESEERFRAIFRAASDGILILNESGRILEANYRAREMCGTGDSELTDVSIFDLGADRADLEKAIHEARTTAEEAPPDGAATLVQWQVVGPSGRTFWAESSFKATELGGQPRLVAVVRDVTQRKRLEDQLRHSQKIEALGTLAGGVAHDFNNILTAIMGHNELVRAQTAAGSPSWSSLDGIAEACDRATGVTRSLLTFYRKETAEKRRTELGELIAATLHMLRPMLPAAIEVSIDTPGHGVWVQVDRNQMQQVLMNLALNARDAMPEGGCLRIALLETTPLPGTLGLATISVSDTGVGMAEGVRERVFEPFFTTKPRERGTGLGMAVVHGILIEHDGQLEIESEPGRGTRVLIRLPRALPEAGVVAVAAALPEAPAAAQRILVVEDDTQVRSLLVATLRSTGYEVCEAVDGVDGLAAMEDPSCDVDLMVLDIDLPRLNGKSVLRQARAGGVLVPVVLISGDPTHTFEGGLPDDVTFLQKPFPLADFTRVVARMLAEVPGGWTAEVSPIPRPAAPRR